MIATATKSIAAAFVVAAALGATTAQAAPVKNGDKVRVAGTCTDKSSSKLKVKRDNGRLQVEFEVDQNRNSVPWTVELRKDGRVVFSGTRVTSAPSGSFSLERRIAGLKGLIKASATRNGETCTAVMQPGKTLVSTTPTATTPASGTVSDDGPAHDVGDDNGVQTTVPVAGHDVGDDNGGHHGNDD